MRWFGMVWLLGVLGCVEQPALETVEWVDSGSGVAARDAGVWRPDTGEAIVVRDAGAPVVVHWDGAAEGGGADPSEDGDGGKVSRPRSREPVEAGVEATSTVGYGELVISEWMADPKALGDTEGEWFELFNPGSEPIDLQGCTIGDGADQVRAIAQPLMVAAAGFVTLARSAEPGFAADLVTSFSLTNAADSLELRCSGVLIDRVAYDKAQGFPIRAGSSTALDPGRADADQNDAADAWCLASEPYAEDLGTPGKPNPACAPLDDAGVDSEP